MIARTSTILGILFAAACGNDPLRPSSAPLSPSAGVSRTAPKCSDYRVVVSQLISLVQRQTSGATRTTLLADLNNAYAAMNPTACNAGLATTHLRQFIADVKANASFIDAGLALTLVRIAETIINNLAPFTG